jgi:hypothetical protein
MRFNMTKPCKDCPFRVGSSTNMTLAEGRIEEIVDDLRRDMSFTCHKTLDMPNMEQEHCAGALIFLEKEDNPNQIMRFAERIGLYDRHKLKMDCESLIRSEDYK